MVSPIELESRAGMRLWLVDLEQGDGADDSACLSKTESARAQRFVFPMHRRRYIAAHVALRELLAKFTGQTAASLDIRETPLGKPFLAGANACAFNLSHSQGIALVAIAPSGEIGVDVEVMRAVPDAAALSAELFTAAERRELAEASTNSNDQSRDSSFLSGWTRKEACLKAVGIGLGIRPDSVEVGLAPRLRTVAVPTASRMVDVELHSFGDVASFVAAAALVRSSL